MERKEVNREITIVCGPFHPHLEGELISLLEKGMPADSIRTSAVVVPSEEMRRCLKERLTIDRPLSFVGLYLLTAYRFAFHVAGLGFAGGERMRRPILEALVSRLVSEGQYPSSFKEMALSRGGMTAIMASLRDLEEGLLLQSAEPSLPIIKLYRDFSAARERKDLVTDSDPIHLAIEKAGESLFLESLDSLYIYGFYEMTGIQRQLAVRCAEFCQTTILLPHVIDHPAGEFSARFLSDLKEQLELSGLGVRIKAAGAHSTPVGFQAGLLEGMFSPQPRPATSSLPMRLIDVSGFRAEVEMAAKEVLRLHEEEGLPYREIGVIARSLEPYQDCLEEIFGENGLPFWSSSRLPMSRVPPVGSVFSLSRILVDDFRHEDVLALLVSPWLSLDRRGANDVFGFVRRRGVISGCRRWRVAAKILQREGKVSASKIITGLIESDATFPQRASWKEMAHGTADLLERWLDISSYDGSDREALEKCFTDLRELGGLDGFLPETDRSTFFELFYRLLVSESLPVGGAYPGGVAVLDAMSARGRSFRALILLGLNERLWPPPAREDPFLPDKMKEDLNARYGSYLGLSGNRYLEERLIFWLILSSARENLSIIWQRSDNEGKPVVRSWYIHELARAAGFPGGLLPEGAIGHLPRLLGDRFGGDLYPDRYLTPGEWSHRLIIDGVDTTLVADIRGIPVQMLGGVQRSTLSLGLFSGRLQGQDGIVGAEAMTDAFGALCRRGFSPSALEDYARCPFAFFLKHLLRLGVEGRPGESTELTPKGAGSLVHKLLQRFFERISKNACPDHEIEALLKRTADETFEDYEKNNLLPHHFLWRKSREALSFLALEYVLGEMVELEARDLAPRGFELTMDSAMPREWPPPAAGLAVTGRVDRIDTGPGDIRVIDYKYRASANSKKVDLYRLTAMGQALQPGLYLLMAEGLAERGERVSLEFHYLGLRWPDKVVRASLADDFWRGEGQSFGQKISGLIDGIRRGEFFIRPGDSEHGCRECHYGILCRRLHRPTRYRLAADPRVSALNGLFADEDKNRTNGEDGNA